ncbi:hypothetical protein PVAP13_5NG290881 [Panicum virgatum]|uniref:Uncharacterized protein n=1 Tax=Panicum virgatum TaxID=38727 RepID=A0A8T0RVN0_PANVG|nr:hypothetical protein PVAP13_5NG290881 [Panicum virgatum]
MGLVDKPAGEMEVATESLTCEPNKELSRSPPRDVSNIDIPDPADVLPAGQTSEMEGETQNKEGPTLQTPASAGRSDSSQNMKEHVYTRRSTRSSSVVDGKNNAEAEATKKMEETKKKKQQKIKSALKKKRSQIQLNKEIQAIRNEHEKRLVVLRDLADEEISKLKRSVPGVAGPSSAQASDANFPEDSAVEINSQTPPIRLSQEEME